MTVPRALLITLSNIGDLVLTTPVLEALHTYYPEHRVDIVADPRSSTLLTHCPYRGEIHHRHKREGLAGLLRLIAALRAHHYDLIIDLRTDFLPWLLRGARCVAKFQALPHGPHAVAQHFAVAARWLPAAASIPAAKLWIDDDLRVYAATQLQSLPGDRWLALAPGANWPGKIWPLGHFIELTRMLAEDFDAIIVLGGPADADAAHTLLTQSALAGCAFAGRTELLQAAALLERATAFVGNDSGLGHMAAAMGVPTLTLFGPGKPDRYRPWGEKAAVALAPEEELAQLTAADVVSTLRQHLTRLGV